MLQSHGLFALAKHLLPQSEQVRDWRGSRQTRRESARQCAVNQTAADAVVGRCPDGQSVTSLNRETQGIFDDLTNEEIDAVLNYTRQIACFNQRDDVTSSGNVTTIAVIELRPPTKHKAIRYLDAGGPAPPRNARVVLYRQVHAFSDLHGESRGDGTKLCGIPAGI